MMHNMDLLIKLPGIVSVNRGALRDDTKNGCVAD